MRCSAPKGRYNSEFFEILLLLAGSFKMRSLRNVINTKCLGQKGLGIMALPSSETLSEELGHGG